MARKNPLTRAAVRDKVKVDKSITKESAPSMGPEYEEEHPGGAKFPKGSLAKAQRTGEKAVKKGTQYR